MPSVILFDQLCNWHHSVLARRNEVTLTDHDRPTDVMDEGLTLELISSGDIMRMQDYSLQI